MMENRCHPTNPVKTNKESNPGADIKESKHDMSENIDNHLYLYDQLLQYVCKTHIFHFFLID